MRRSSLTAACVLLALAASFPADEARSVLPEEIVNDRGLAVVVGDDLEHALHLAETGRWLVHVLVLDDKDIEVRRAEIHKRGLGGRVVVGVLPAGGCLPHPDRFVNLVVANLDQLGKRAPQSKEMQRALAVRGQTFLKKDGAWKRENRGNDERLDGWFAHWYDASGNCLSQDRAAGLPRSVQWQHGPAMQDGTADGKIIRIAEGRALFLDNETGDLLCRDAGNGLLLWRRAVGSRQNSDLAIAAGRVHLWFDAEAHRAQRERGREIGPLVALDLASGKVAQTYERGLRAGTADSVEVPFAGRTRKIDPVPWFVVNDRLVVQAYGPDLVVLERKTGQVRFKQTLKGATWFSPIIAGDLVLAAEAVEPGTRQRNDGSDHVRAVVAFDAGTGKLRWRNQDIHPARKVVDKRGNSSTERSSFKTMSAANGLLLLHISSYQFRSGGSIAIHELGTGKFLWRHEFKPHELYTQGSQRPVLRTGEVVVLDGTGVYRFSARTGEARGEAIKRPRDLKRTGRTNGACTASRATVDWLMVNGWLYVDDAGKPHINQAARGACGQGVIPAQGLVYVAPTPCDCGDYMRGYLALASTRSGTIIDADQRLVSGVEAPADEKPAAGWPVFLGNSQRTSATTAELPATLKLKWQARIAKTKRDALEADRRNSERFLGTLSAPVAAGGLVVVAAAEEHRVVAVDVRSGQVRWFFNAGGKVDSPPTLARGLAVFGCDDGCIYALRASDGRLVWRFRAAATDGLALLHGHLASSFPIPGSVLVFQDTVIAVAGQHTDLDGLHVWSLDLKTGKPRAHRVLGNDRPPALSNNLTVADADGKSFWVVSPQGGSYGAGGAYHLSLKLEDLPVDKSSPVICFDRQGSRLRFQSERGRGGSTHGWKGAMRAAAFNLKGHRIVVTDKVAYALVDPDQRSNGPVVWGSPPGKKPMAHWQLKRADLGNVPSLSAVALAGDQLFVGGGARDGSAGKLFVIDARTGRLLATHDLPARVTECGLAISAGHLFIACEDGSLHAFGR